MLRARANGETFVSATMCPRLPGPLHLHSFSEWHGRPTDSVKSHVKAPGVYNFARGFGLAYQRGIGVYIRGGWCWDIKTSKINESEQREKTYLRKEFMLT